MARTRDDVRIRDWRERFQKDTLAASVVAALRGRADEIWQGAFALMQRESPEYRNAVDDDFTRESKGHCGELLKNIVAIASGRALPSAGDPFEFVRTHAAWRARHRVPLIASLHAYRLAHRTYWEKSRDAILRAARRDDALRSLTMLSDFWIELFDHVGAVLAEAHAVEERLMVAESTESHIGLIDGLLRGIVPSDPESERLCSLYGLRPSARLAVVVARPLGAARAETDLEVSLRSLVRLIDQVLPASAFGKLVDIRDGEVVAVACGDADISRRVVIALRRGGLARRAANGRAAAVGVSLDAEDVASIPRGLEEARTAVEFATDAQPLMHFADIDLPEFLIRRADAAALRLVPEWARRLSDSGDQQSRELSRTLRSFAACSFNVKQTASRLRVHINTVYFRLNRINALTGVNPRTYDGASRLLTALQLLEMHQGGAPARVTPAPPPIPPTAGEYRRVRGRGA
jgi:PucR-like helix-turn-helix protein/diguanylate cyclase with GGDEF domain